MAPKIELQPLFWIKVSNKQSATMASFTFKSEPVTCIGETEPYKPIEVKDGKTAMHAVMSIFMNHTAEVFHGVVDAISDHYKISKDEMMDVILSHPAYTQIAVNPILNDLHYLRPEAKGPVAPQPKPKRKYVVKAAVASPSEPEPVKEEPERQHVPLKEGESRGGEGKAEPERQHAPPKKFQPKKVAAKPT